MERLLLASRAWKEPLTDGKFEWQCVRLRSFTLCLIFYFSIPFLIPWIVTLRLTLESPVCTAQSARAYICPEVAIHYYPSTASKARLLSLFICYRISGDIFKVTRITLGHLAAIFLSLLQVVLVLLEQVFRICAFCVLGILELKLGAVWFQLLLFTYSPMLSLNQPVWFPTLYSLTFSCLPYCFLWFLFTAIICFCFTL